MAELPYYASINDLVNIRRCIESGNHDLDEQDHNNYTPLHWAAMYGHFEVTKLLCEAGADPEIRNDNGNTPLLLASEKGFIRLVKYYLEERKCDIDVRNIWKANPLQMACVFGNKDIVEYLVEERGASLDVRNKYGATPLHFAFAGGQTEIIRYLLIKGLAGEFESRTHEGLTFFLARRFVAAAARRHPEIGLRHVNLLPVEAFVARAASR
ncbi:unnamed protein product, partial [Heterosigma akashiwo]